MNRDNWKAALRLYLDRVEARALHPLHKKDIHVEFLDEMRRDVESRLDAGEREYGNRTFDMSVSAIVGNILEEASDGVGWNFFLAERLRDEKCRPVVTEGCMQVADRFRDVFEYLMHFRSLLVAKGHI